MGDNKPTIDKFNSAIRIAVKHAIDDKVRLMVTPENVSLLETLMGDESTAGTWMCDWLKYSDPTLCTQPIIQSINKLRKKLEKAMSDVCDDIPKRIWTDDDRLIFGRKTGAEDPPSKPPQISVKIVPSMKNLGGGMLKCGCKTATDQSRASLVDGANGVMMNYRLDKLEYVDDGGGNETIGKVKWPPIYGPNDGTTTEVSSNATLELKLGASVLGLGLQYYLCYINTAHPENNGPWSGPFQIILS
jgi:hypothetical protein